jgi:primase-polymerase (primpol)-like protein
LSKRRPRPRPVALAPLFENIPAALRALLCWVCWKFVWKPEKAKWDKVPFIARKTEEEAKSNDSFTWSSFQEAVIRYETGGVDGVGLMFGDGKAGTGLVGVEIDDCRNPETGELTPLAVEVLKKLGPTYAEVSPGGEGLHVLLKGRKPGTHCERTVDGQEIGIYEWGRYFTFTGHRLEGVPETIEDCQAGLEELYL